MLSVYAGGVIVGRFLSGLALDRVPAHYVALAALGLPALGYAAFAADASELPVICVAIMLVGLAQGAEADIGAYLVSRRFGLENFSLLLSLVTMMILIGSSLGSAILSFSLRVTAGYQTFFVLSIMATLLGAVFFVLTGRFAATTPHLVTSSPD